MVIMKGDKTALSLSFYFRRIAMHLINRKTAPVTAATAVTAVTLLLILIGHSLSADAREILPLGR